MSLLEGRLPDWVHRRAIKGCPVARSVIVRRNIPLAKWWIRRQARVFRSMSLEELMSEALIGLDQAAIHHDPSRGTRFSTTAKIWMFQQASRTAAKNQSWFGEPINARLGSRYIEKLGEEAAEDVRRHLERKRVQLPFALQSNAKRPWHDLVVREEMARVSAAMAEHFCSRDAEIIRRKFGNGELMAHIGCDIGVSRERVRQVCSAGIHKLRRVLK